MVLENSRFSQETLIQIVNPILFKPVLDVLRHELVFYELLDEGGLHGRLRHSLLTGVFVVASLVGHSIRDNTLAGPYLVYN